MFRADRGLWADDNPALQGFRQQAGQIHVQPDGLAVNKQGLFIRRMVFDTNEKPGEQAQKRIDGSTPMMAGIAPSAAAGLQPGLAIRSVFDKPQPI